MTDLFLLMHVEYDIVSCRLHNYAHRNYDFTCNNGQFEVPPTPSHDLSLPYPRIPGSMLVFNGSLDSLLISY